MKETLEIIPLMKAFEENDECPFCYLHRKAEQHAISFIMGSAYMEDDVRMETDKVGFCRHHYKMMYDYGNRLGSALILETHMKKFNQELAKELKKFKPEKTGLFKSKKGVESNNSLTAWLKEKEESCYVCAHYQNNYSSYLNTFFTLYRKNKEFREMFANCKGFCVPHFADLVDRANEKLANKDKEEFFETMFDVMQKNMERVQEDVAWFVMKNDYLNKDKPWNNAADSVQRGMQKCAGGYPADPVFKQKP